MRKNHTLYLELEANVYFFGQFRLHLVNQTHFSNFCEGSELGKTEFKLGRSWGFRYKALLRDWAGIPSCRDPDWLHEGLKGELAT